MSNTVQAEVVIEHNLGLHLRAAGALTQKASQFRAEIKLFHRGLEANAKSIMSVLSLAAPYGAKLKLEAQGQDAQDAVDAIRVLIEERFGLE